MDEQDFASENFVANLKLACSYHASTSEVCRRLGVNRQQFMKYLAGTAFPSRRNLRRICDFFGIDEYEILMPRDQFREIIRLRPHPKADDLNVPPLLRSLLVQAQRQKAQLSKHIGYYYKYYPSFTSPGNILRSLVCVFPKDDYVFFKRIERLEARGGATRYVFKYLGLVMRIGDRLHLIDHEAIVGSETTQTILYPTYRNRILTLAGMVMGISSTEAHQPTASRVVLEYVGRSINKREALSNCGLLSPESGAVPAAVLDYLNAPSPRSSIVLRAELP